MKIYLNGHSHELETTMVVADLLESIGLGHQPVVVELNEEAVFPRDYTHIMIEENARVEIVTLAAGG